MVQIHSSYDFASELRACDRASSVGNPELKSPRNGYSHSEGLKRDREVFHPAASHKWRTPYDVLGV